MPPLTRRPRPDDQWARVLALAADLADDLEALDLDAVDGEFFWRCCRADLLEAAEALTDGRPRPIGARAPRADGAAADDGALDLRVEPTEVFDYLREGLRFAGDFLTLADEVARLYPGVVWRRLLDGDRVPMRGAEAEVRHRPDLGGVPLLRLKVFSGAWTGAQVEDEVRRLAASAARWFLGEPTGDQRALAVRVAFAFVDGAGALVAAGGDGASCFPYVAVDVELPLPPEGVVAREYDALVRARRGWHRDLPGGGSRQDKEVAVRTWAVGLLVAAGQPVNDAMDAVARRIGLVGVTQTRFGQDRQKLLERVPEAKPYLFARGSGGEAGERGKGTVALANPAATGALGNPTAPLPPLQVPEPEEGAYT